MFLQICRVRALSLTVVTEATAAGEQSTSVTSLCTVCHGSKGDHAQRSKVKLCEVVIELRQLQPSCLPLWLTLSEALIFEVTPRVLTTKVKYKQVLLSFYTHKGGLIYSLYIVSSSDVCACVRVRCVCVRACVCVCAYWKSILYIFAQFFSYGRGWMRGWEGMCACHTRDQ